MKQTLQCVCGAEVGDVTCLRFVNEGGVVAARCLRESCRLERVLTISKEGGKALVAFSKMFTDYNMLLMGRDQVEKRLEELGRQAAANTSPVKNLKPVVKYR